MGSSSKQFQNWSLMARYFLRRLGTSVTMLFTVSLLVFVVLRVLPGDPVTILLGPGNRGIGEDDIQEYRTKLGLDKPLLVQYFLWFSNFLRGDMGNSLFSNEPVSSMFSGHIMPTVQLTLAAIFMAIFLAITLALIGAIWPRSFVDRFVTFIASLGMAIPTFITAIILLLTFGIFWPILPTRGYVPFSEDPIGNLKMLTMPAITLAFAAMAPILRMLRASLAEASSSPWTRTAEGKGLLWNRIVLKHIFPNALIPSLTIVGITFGRMLGGAVLIEFIFAWPGIGTMMVDAIFKRDYAVLQATILFAAIASITVNFIVDIAYGFVDPRLRLKS